MKKNRVNEILIDQTRRRRTIFSYICIIVVVSIVFFALFLVCFNRNEDYYVNYDESSNIDYNVHLKENDFFEKDYLEKDNQYIASLIDYINATFDYKLSIDEDNVDYRYTYQIDAVVDVVEKNTGNSLYKFDESLISEKSYTSNSNNDVNITENVSIDYNYYNNIIKKFVDVYDLTNFDSTLTINMKVNVFSSCDEVSNDKGNESVVSLVIPLTTSTVAIDISSDLVDSVDNLMACNEKSETSYFIIILSILLLVLDTYLIVSLIRYVISTRTAKSIYDNELKKILNNYRSYIQKINNQFDLSGYQVLKVDTFTDMLEIRDTIQEPILMVENKDKNGTYFLIPSKTKILYSYGLKVSDIKKQMEDN